MRADIINTKSTFGRNLTPKCIIDSVKVVLGSIDLDPCSDSVANYDIGAKEYYWKEKDGYSQNWKADTLFLNPPGTSITRKEGISDKDWLKDLSLFESSDPKDKPVYCKQVKSAEWVEKLWDSWRKGDVDNAIYVCYRGGSIGGIPYDMLNSSAVIVCLTCKGSRAARDKGNKAISGSGRVCFETVDSNDNRVIADHNTQSSAIILLSENKNITDKFFQEFRQYGAILKKY